MERGWRVRLAAIDYKRMAPANMLTTVIAMPAVAPIVDKAEAALRSGVLPEPEPEPPKAGAMDVDSGLD
jgi:hypothetical protein